MSDARLEALREIYESLPTIACKGLCWNSCGPIDMSVAEHQRITELGVDIPMFTIERSQRWANDEPLHCPALDKVTKRCTVYEDRPLICRAWGVADSMPCPHGCEATGTLGDRELFELLLESFDVGGNRYDKQGEEMRAFLVMFDDPEIAPLLARFIRGDRSVEPEMVAAINRKLGVA